MFLLIVSAMFGSVNTITTIVQLRAPGLTWFRLPFFVWRNSSPRFLLLLAFPPLQGAAICSSRIGCSGQASSFRRIIRRGCGGEAAGGGNPLLWQHLFWFLATPRSTC
jgi:cytochrome c oxidase subunit 1